MDNIEKINESNKDTTNTPSVVKSFSINNDQITTTNTLESTYPYNYNIGSYNVYNGPHKSKYHWIKVALICIIKLVISLIALKLSWACNAQENIFIRIILGFITFMFSEIYIVYYAVYRTFMGNKCY